MAGNQIDTIKNVSEDQFVWSDQGVRLAYKDQDENLMIYDLEQNQSRNIGSKMDADGWLDQSSASKNVMVERFPRCKIGR